MELLIGVLIVCVVAEFGVAMAHYRMRRDAELMRDYYKTKVDLLNFYYNSPNPTKIKEITDASR